MPAPLSAIDLHAHSTASDGTLSPAAVVTAAATAGVTCFALTDHDSVAGLPEAERTARALGLQLVPGIELSANWERKGLHVVGLGIDPETPALQAGLRQQQDRREQRATAIAAKLEKLGLSEALDKAKALASGGQITRTHFARLLVAEGRCKSLKKAFERYLGAGQSAYVGVEWAGLDEVIGWIHTAGGQAVLAHPLHYKLSATQRERMLLAFCAAGGDGVEVSCGNSDPADVQLSAREAQRHGLKGSVGSDFHGPDQVWLGLGRLHPLPAGVTPVWLTPGLA